VFFIGFNGPNEKGIEHLAETKSMPKELHEKEFGFV
jgi:hypothetical protein